MEPLEGPVSERVARAKARSIDRRDRQRSAAQPLLLVAGVMVVVAQFAGSPEPGLRGTALGVTLALVAYMAGLGTILIGGLPADQPRAVALVAVVGAAGVALAGLAPQGAAELASSVAVLLATIRLPRAPALWIAVPVSVALGVVTAATTHDPFVPTAASLLLCLLLGTFGLFMRESRLGQDRTELLLAELEDAREAGEVAAAGAERARIARDLHDVLAHSLSGLAIQLEVARAMALREQVGPELQDVLDRSRTLVAEGLAEAKAAVGALRDGSPAPAGVADLPGLVETYRHDFGLDTALAVTGTTRPLPSPVEDALYRAAQEALTNAARHAPGSRVRLDLQWRHDCVALTVADSGPAPGAAPTPVGTGGGRGLVGMKERVAAAGGSVSAGPAALGWSVRVEVPG